MVFASCLSRSRTAFKVRVVLGLSHTDECASVVAILWYSDAPQWRTHIRNHEDSMHWPYHGKLSILYRYALALKPLLNI